MFEKVKESIASKMRSFLKIHTANGKSFNIDELLDFDSNVAVNKIWYRGESYELNQLYKQLDDNQYGFWGSVPTAGIEIRKIHTGLPKIMVNLLSSVVADDLQDVKFTSEADNTLWRDIATENVFDTLVKSAINKTLYTGDGAFKISIDTDISQLPIIEFFEADRIKVKRKRGRVVEIIFKTAYSKDTNTYILYEHYGKGYIRYELKNSFDKEVELATLEQTAGLTNIEWDGDFMLAEYISFYSSDKFEGRGQSVFDAKRDNFDALSARIGALETKQAVADAVEPWRAKVLDLRINGVAANAQAGINLEAERRCCADNKIVNYVNSTFVPQTIAEPTIGSATHSESIYNPLCGCCSPCGRVI